MNPHVVLIGGGIGLASALAALQDALYLNIIDITVITESRTFHTMDNLPYAEWVFQSTKILCDRPQQISSGTRTIILQSGENLRYDFCLICPTKLSVATVPEVFETHRDSIFHFDLKEHRDVLLNLLIKRGRMKLEASKDSIKDSAEQSVKLLSPLSTSSDEEDTPDATATPGNPTNPPTKSALKKVDVPTTRPYRLGIVLAPSPLPSPSTEAYLQRCQDKRTPVCPTVVYALQHQTLEHIDLQGCEELCTPEGMGAFVDVLVKESKETFPASVCLRQVPLPAVTAPMISMLMQGNQRIRTLDLRDNKLGDMGFAALEEGLRANRTLSCLLLGNNAATKVGMLALANGLQGNSTLKELDVSHNGGGGEIIRVLDSLTNIEALDLNNTGLTSRDFVNLSVSLQRCTVCKTLKLGHNVEVGDEGILSICPFLNALEHVDVSNLPLVTGPIGTLSVIESVMTSKTLKVLKLKGTSSLKLPEALRLGTLFQNNTVLTTLDVSVDPLLPSIGVLLAEGIAGNSSIVDLIVDGSERFDQESLDKISNRLSTTRVMRKAPEQRRSCKTPYDYVNELVENAIFATNKTGEDIEVTVFDASIPNRNLAPFFESLLNLKYREMGILRHVFCTEVSYPSYCDTVATTRIPHVGIFGGIEVVPNPHTWEVCPGLYAFGPNFKGTATTQFTFDQWEDVHHWGVIAREATACSWGILNDIRSVGKSNLTFPKPTVPTWCPPDSTPNLHQVYVDLFKGKHGLTSLPDFYLWQNVALMLEESLKVIDLQRPPVTVDYFSMTKEEILAQLEAKLKEKEEREKREREEREKREKAAREAEKAAKAKKKKEGGKEAGGKAEEETVQGDAGAAGNGQNSGGQSNDALSRESGVLHVLCRALLQLHSSGVYRSQPLLSTPCDWWN